MRKLGWPQDTLNKFKNLADASTGTWTTLNTGKVGKEVLLPLESFDFAFMTDADQEFRQDVCEDVLGTRVALVHPQYFDRSLLASPNPTFDPSGWRESCKHLITNGNEEAFPNVCAARKACNLGGPFDQDPRSESFVEQERMNMFDYVSAHIFGGTGSEFMRMVRVLKQRTDENAAKGVVPFVHGTVARAGIIDTHVCLALLRCCAVFAPNESASESRCVLCVPDIYIYRLVC